MSKLSDALASKAFVVTSELTPPKGTDLGPLFAKAELLKPYATAINLTESHAARMAMDPVAVGHLLLDHGVEPIVQMTSRDKNRLAIQASILGASALGIPNVVFMGGDPPKNGDHPDAKPVFDFDCISLLQTVTAMRDEGEFLSGRKLTTPPRVFLGAAANPFGPPLDYRPIRLEKKINAGAQFVQTQYCFDLERLQEYMGRVRDMGLTERCYILVGVGPMPSARTASWIRDNVPGVHIPDAVIKRLLGAQDQREEGVRICVEMVQAVREIQGVHGVHIMAYKQEERVRDIVGESGVLEGRIPWYPGVSNDQPGQQT